jgi:competence protein ComEC
MDQAAETAVLSEMPAAVVDKSPGPLGPLEAPAGHSGDSAHVKATAASVSAAASASVSASALAAPVDVLKVAHHGSKTSTGSAWLEAWRPRIAVISVGAFNSYGHPNPQVLSRLEEHKMSIFRTDKHGEIQVRVKDGSMMLRTKL